MHPSALRDRTLMAFMLSACLASTIGGLPFNLLPVLLGSMPSLQNSSKLMCMWAGVIQVVVPGQFTEMIP